MRYARVAVDVPSRVIDRAFTYSIPHDLEADVATGTCVLVDFGNRPVVGYVVACDDVLAPDVDSRKVKPIRRILDDPYFDDEHAQLAQWVAQTYAAPLSEAIRLLTPPGGSPRVVRDGVGEWTLADRGSRESSELWVLPNEETASFSPAKNASKQRAVLEAVTQGAVRVADLALDMSDPLSAVRALEKRGIVTVQERRRLRGYEETSLSSAAAPTRSLEELTAGQRDALEAIRSARDEGPAVIVLDGVTGSGKTEVYLSAIAEVLADGRSAVVLVPEISLTAQTVGRFRSRFGDRVAVLHSRLSAGERFDQWDLARRGAATVVVGARSALFAPLKDIGIIILDEEHEQTYKQSSSPRYHARETAEALAELVGCPLVLGSATPSIEALHRTAPDAPPRALPWHRISMPERVNADRALPPVSVVDMTHEFSVGHRSMFSRKLITALEEVVERGEKAVLMLNRRGFANFLLCRECGFVPTCDHCSTSLTYHERGKRLTCHSCATDYPAPARCPQCDSPYLRMFGAGTQRVEDELAALLGPDVPIIRMDADTTRNKGGHEKLLRAFDSADSAILLGTQMIAKGLDFPDVTLVGVINADTTLNLPDFRSPERTYALLEQVSGRAGRGDKPGRVIIQTYWPEHPAIQAVAAHDRSIFLDAELPDRERGYYPPYSRLVNITAWGDDLEAVDAYVQSVRVLLVRELENEVETGHVRILGPAECIISRQKDAYRRHVLVKLPPERSDLHEVFTKLPPGGGISVSIDVDPYNMM